MGNSIKMRLIDENFNHIDQTKRWKLEVETGKKFPKYYLIFGDKFYKFNSESEARKYLEKI